MGRHKELASMGEKELEQDERWVPRLCLVPMSKACHPRNQSWFRKKTRLPTFFGVYLLSFLVEGLGRYTNLLCQNGLNLVKVKIRTIFENEQARWGSKSMKYKYDWITFGRISKCWVYLNWITIEWEATFNSTVQLQSRLSGNRERMKSEGLIPKVIPLNLFLDHVRTPKSKEV